jgi:hypothetical protein
VLYLGEGGLLVEAELLRHDETLPVVLDADRLLHGTPHCFLAVAGRLALPHYIIPHHRYNQSYLAIYSIFHAVGSRRA